MAKTDIDTIICIYSICCVYVYPYIFLWIIIPNKVVCWAKYCGCIYLESWVLIIKTDDVGSMPYGKSACAWLDSSWMYKISNLLPIWINAAFFLYLIYLSTAFLHMFSIRFVRCDAKSGAQHPRKECNLQIRHEKALPWQRLFSIATWLQISKRDVQGSLFKVGCSIYIYIETTTKCLRPKSHTNLFCLPHQNEEAKWPIVSAQICFNRIFFHFPGDRWVMLPTEAVNSRPLGTKRKKGSW